MRPFLILVLILTLMGSVVVLKMLLSNFHEPFKAAPVQVAEPEAKGASSGVFKLEADLIREYHLPEDGRPHSLNVKPTEHLPDSSNRIVWD
jgi:hypothetical protein